MVFDYYHRLNRRQQAVYRRSDAVAEVRVPEAGPLQPVAAALAETLAAGRRDDTQRLAQELMDGLTQRLDVPPVKTRVRSCRPSHHWGELHGLYEPAEERRRARVTVWMRTAQRRRVVAFRTFLRTLLHELCHHVDYELLGLPDSFHTEGFYRRESSLFHQLVVAPRGGAAARTAS